MSELDKNKVVKATKWSAITEVIAKLITPVTSMVLARVLTPEAFGIVATVAMIVSFAEIFTDAGFQKYLIQHEFVDAEDREQSTNVAFWSNLAMALLLWLFISLFNEPLARLVGNPGLGHVLIIASISLPLSAFSSIQMALYKRDLDFQTLFKARLIGVCIPLLVTIPLALWLRNFWALIIGTIATNLVNAVVLTYFSKWKPKLFYSWKKFKEMFSFSMWSMIESISIWLTGYVDIFIVGVALSQYYLGLYKTATSIVGQITALITSITTPVLFASLSRLQQNRNEFEYLFLKFQKLVALLIIPLGVGIYCYRDFITLVLLGEQWSEAADFVGMWGLTSAVTIVLAHYSSEVYRALGKPKLSVLAQLLHIIALWPAVMISVQYGFEILCITRSLIRLELVLVQLIIMYAVIRLSPWKMFKNIFPASLAAIVMGIVAHYLLKVSGAWIWTVCSIGICLVIYVLIICLFKQERKELIFFAHKL